MKAVSSGLKKKTPNGNSNSKSATLEADTNRNEKHNAEEDHETKVKEAGSSRRNITRKKATENSQLYDNKKKKQGGAGYVKGSSYSYNIYLYYSS